MIGLSRVKNIFQTGSYLLNIFLSLAKLDCAL